MCGHTILDRIRNEDIHKREGILPTENLRENHLRWYEHIVLKSMDALPLVRRSDRLKIGEVRRDKGR